jgi:hypothetical protein
MYGAKVVIAAAVFPSATGIAALVIFIEPGAAGKTFETVIDFAVPAQPFVLTA